MNGFFVLFLYLKENKVNLDRHHIAAFEAIIEGSKILMQYYRTPIDVVSKEDGSPVTKADLESSNRIVEILSPIGIPIMCEEHEIPEYEDRAHWESFWCVDPLDGTKMFLAQNDEFAINVALIENGIPTFGAVGDPVNKRILFGLPETGAFVFNYEDYETPEKWIEIQPKTTLNNPLSVICSRSYRHGSGFKLIRELERQFGEIRFIMKGSALKFFDIVEGKADLYTRFGPTMEWDVAAGDAIMQSVGGRVVQIEDNSRMRYNKPSLYNPPFMAKTKPLLSE